MNDLPQLENGYTKIANEIIEKLCRYRISGEEMQCLWVIIRKTYGYNKKDDKIALSQFANYTELKPQTVYRALKKLSSKMIIDIIKNDDRYTNKYRFNKDFSQWKLSSKKIIIKNDYNQKRLQVIIKNDDTLSSNLINTKETLKETLKEIKKEAPQAAFILPEFIDKEIWDEFLKMRKSKKAPNSNYALNLVLGKLNKIGGNVNELLKQSLERGWTTVFPISELKIKPKNEPMPYL